MAPPDRLSPTLPSGACGPYGGYLRRCWCGYLPRLIAQALRSPSICGPSMGVQVPGSFNTFQAVYYRAPDGSQPVDDFIDALPPRHQAVVDLQVERLNDLHAGRPHLPYPHSSQVRGELRELRCHFGNDLYRILYRRSDNLLILLHAFAKRTEAIPEQQIRIAQQRWDDFKRRMESSPRVPPRAAGHDAP